VGRAALELTEALLGSNFFVHTPGVAAKEKVPTSSRRTTFVITIFAQASAICVVINTARGWRVWLLVQHNGVCIRAF